MSAPRVSMIAAIGDGLVHKRVLGRDNKLIWHLPEDLQHFKRLTMGHPVIMGRRTFESIVQMIGRPLPGRHNIVVSWNPAWSHEGTMSAASLEDALALARSLDQEEIFIGGGGQIFTEALPYADRLYLTVIDDDQPGDTFFPPYESEFTKVISKQERQWEGINYRWVTLEREQPLE